MKYIEKYPYLILLLICFGVYFQTLFYDISYCDDITIMGTQFNRISNIDRIDDELFKGYLDTDYYRPIINISFILDAALGGRSPFVYHLNNLLYHIFIIFLFYYIMIKLKYDLKYSLLLAIILSIHPLLLNAVAWIPGRNDLLLTLFSLLSFNFLINYINRGKIFNLILSSFTFLLALLSKETASILVILFTIYAYFHNGKSRQDTIRVFLSLFLSIVVALIMRFFAELGASVNKMGIGVIMMNLSVFGEITSKFFLPINISVLPVYSIYYTIFGSLVLIIMIIFPLLRKVRSFNLYFGLSWFILTLLPTILVTTQNSDEWNQYLECRSYLPVIGLFIYISELLKIYIQPKYYLLSLKAFIIIAILFASINLYKSKVYEDGISFYSSAVSDFPDRSLYKEILGNLYMEVNKSKDAENMYKDMIAANPTYSKNFLKMADFYFNQKNYDSSIYYAKKSVELDSNANATSLMINSFISNNMPDSAINYLSAIYQDSTKYPEAYIDLINLLINQKRYDDALNIAKDRISKGYDRSIFTDIFYSWTQYFFKEKDNVGVIRTMEKGIEIEPNNIEVLKYLVESYRNAGLIDKSQFYEKKLNKLLKKF